jgi:hypothetical protein
MIEVRIPGDEVVAYLIAQGATSTDAHQTFPGGRHHDNIARYVRIIEAGEWEETRRPIMLDAKTGTVYKGTDRATALSMVDWSKTSVRPMFIVQVEHPRSPDLVDPLKETGEEREA